MVAIHIIGPKGFSTERDDTLGSKCKGTKKLGEEGKDLIHTQPQGLGHPREVSSRKWLCLCVY